MTLFKLKSAPLVLIEDDRNKNILPLVLELAQYEKNKLNLFCYEQLRTHWRNVFKDKPNVSTYGDFRTDLFDDYTSTKCSVVIDSVNQMALCLGWNECLRQLKKLCSNNNVAQVILILHKDCFTYHSKLQLQLNHIASAIISYDTNNPFKINIQMKKGGKVVTTEEILSYDSTNSTLKSTPIVKEKNDEAEKPLPSNLTTFKIQVEEKEKLEKDKLLLPYMSKINEGESKIHYEPDAVDDWDEEDPDEDLDI